MTRKQNKVPLEILKQLDINQIKDIKKQFKILPRIEPHQIKLPIPKELVRDLELDDKWKNKKKIALKFDEKNKELRFKI